jgi:hypothetical protein
VCLCVGTYVYVCVQQAQVLEIGALDRPVKLQWHTRYVDVAPLVELRAVYPTAPDIIRPDVLDTIGL